MKCETKYNIGDKVWTINKNKVYECEVSIIQVRMYRTVFTFDVECSITYFLKCIGIDYGIYKSESEIYDTKEELLKTL